MASLEKDVEKQEPRVPGKEIFKEQEPGQSLEVTPEEPEPVYSAFPKWKRVAIVYTASLAAFSSPISSTTYYPAMLQMAADLNVSLTQISLTITTYMVSSMCEKEIY
jgi:hypothetical protein